MSFVVGIDFGGSKTTAAVSDGVSVLGTYTSGESNLKAVHGENAQSNLIEAVDGALAVAELSRSDISGVCAGVAGAASPEVAERIEKILSELMPRAFVQVVGDTVIALEAAFRGASGMICICGTGSVAYGRNGRGELSRAGGWGRIVSDEGSAHWIGQRAISQCLRAMDMGRSSGLITGIMRHWHIATREQLVQRCHQEHIPDFADLFPIVLAAAELGDPLGNEILTAAGTELANIALIVVRRLWGPQSNIEIAISGGVFASSVRVRQVFCNLVRSDRPEVQVKLNSRASFDGALYLAQRESPDTAVS